MDETKRTTTDLRCQQCGRKLAEADGRYRPGPMERSAVGCITIKCERGSCGHLNRFCLVLSRRVA